MTKSHKKELDEIADKVAFFNINTDDFFGDFTIGELSYMYQRRPAKNLRRAIYIAEHRRHDWLDRAHRGLCWLAREVL